jgi:hypothetical protein
MHNRVKGTMGIKEVMSAGCSRGTTRLARQKLDS